MPEGQEATFVKLLVVAERQILGYLVSMVPSIQDAEEILQETSVLMWEKFDEFMETQDGEPSIDRFLAWGNKIAFYKVLNSRRKRRLPCIVFSEDVLEVISEEWLRQNESKELHDRRQALSNCIKSLPKVQSEVLQDYYWHKLTVKKIAEKQQKTTEGVYKILQRVRLSLHRCIERRLTSDV